MINNIGPMRADAGGVSGEGRFMTDTRHNPKCSPLDDTDCLDGAWRPLKPEFSKKR